MNISNMSQACLKLDEHLSHLELQKLTCTYAFVCTCIKVNMLKTMDIQFDLIVYGASKLEPAVSSSMHNINLNGTSTKCCNLL